MKVHKRAAAGICHDKEWAKGEQFHLCFHLKILVQEDTTQGCTISLSAAQGAPVNPFPPPAPSAHPRLQEWSHRSDKCASVLQGAHGPPPRPAPSLLPVELWGFWQLLSPSVFSSTITSHLGSIHAAKGCLGCPSNPRKAGLAPGEGCRKQLGCPHASSVSPLVKHSRSEQVLEIMNTIY